MSSTPAISIASESDLAALGLSPGWPNALVATSSSTLDACQLGAVDLAVLTREGALTCLADGLHVAPNSAENRSARIDLIASVVPDRAVVTQEAAVWIWGGPPMTRVTVTLGKGARLYRPHPAVDVAQNVTIPAAHRISLPRSVEHTVGLNVTSPTWSALDLVRRCSHGATDVTEAVERARRDPWLTWLWETLVEPEAVAHELEGLVRYPGVRRLRAVVAEIATAA